MNVLAGVPSSYGNRFRGPTSPSRDPPFFNNPPPFLTPDSHLLSGTEAVYAARHEYCQFTGGRTYSSHSTLLGSLVAAEANRASSLSFSSTFFTSRPRRPRETPFFPFSRFVPRFHFLFLLEKRTKERDETRERWAREEAEGVNENGSARLTRYWKMASTCAEGSR